MRKGKRERDRAKREMVLGSDIESIREKTLRRG